MDALDPSLDNADASTEVPQFAGDDIATTTARETDIVLTGDRPTGPLHLGHYVGSLASRLVTQEMVARQYVLIADMQALTDHAGASAKVADSVVEVALDYLAVGLDPARTTFVLQSSVPELAELTTLYLNLVTVARLERNPTIKAEIEMRGFQRDLPAGFLCYPAAQAADITAFDATLVPVGDDQLPMIELANEVVAKVNRLAGADVLTPARALLSATPRLPGVDGRKASKSLGNALSLGARPAEITEKVRAMFTDPNHLRAADPGTVEGNVVFAYLDAFDPDRAGLEEVKAHYRRGGLGDMAVKRRLEGILQAFLDPIRHRRAVYARDPAEVMRIVAAGTGEARTVAAATLARVRGVFGLA
jgi:tryptophanyl-tRNA synthetase